MQDDQRPASGDPRKATLSPTRDPIHFSSRATRSGIRQSSLLTVALLAGFAMPAEAQFFWPAERDSFSDAPPPIERQRPRTVKSRVPKLPDAPKDTPKPQGPIVIAISIDQQHMKVFDSNGLFAESPVSTGMQGHGTPTGVFSIIQKNKWHRSNIYSGAPMPYMQRLTWSGIALHAGALPGYPASHGCIRMPANFAMRMWGWTRMGARVIVTSGEVSPVDFAHARLIARKPDTASETRKDVSKETSITQKSDRSSMADAANLSPEKPELRLTSIHSHEDKVRTADASGAAPPRWDAGRDGTPYPPEKPAENSRDAAPAAPKDDATSNDATKTDAGGAAPAAPDSKPADKKTEVPKADKDQARLTDPAAPSASATPPLESSAEFIGPVKPRTGHIAAYVSRKDGKLYVRQNFEPLFEMPITISAPERPLGTHVFTVRPDKDDAQALRWSVVSMPAPVRVARHAELESPRRKRNAPVIADTTPPPPPSSAAEALDRLAIPDDAMKRIAAAIAPGGSIIVSDYGLGDETGRGTDFIVQPR